MISICGICFYVLRGCGCLWIFKSEQGGDAFFHPPFVAVLIWAVCFGDFLEQAFNDCGGGVDQHSEVLLLPRWAGFGGHASSLNRVGSTLLRIDGDAP